MSFEAAINHEFNTSSDAHSFENNAHEKSVPPLELHTPTSAASTFKESSDQPRNPRSTNDKNPTQLPQSLPKPTKPSKPPRSHRSSANQSIASSTNSLTHQLVQQILCTVGELEATLIDDHEHDFNLRMALERQTQKMKDLNHSLENEKGRNVRLMELIRGVDSNSSTDEELDSVFSRCGSGDMWHSRSSDAFESISPLLMQQRYEELSTSYKQCRRQLARKDKQLTQNRCQTEELRTRCDHLLDEYRSEQQNFEQLCCKYLQLQAKKNHEIQCLRVALNHASDCVLNAQQILESLDQSALMAHPHTDHNLTAFKQNLQLFVKALRPCQWVQNSSRRRNARATK